MIAPNPLAPTPARAAPSAHMVLAMSDCSRLCSSSCPLPSTGVGRRAAGRSSAAKVVCLHKALNQQPRKALASPDDATFECLTVLRKPDIESFRQYVIPGVLEEEGSASTSCRTGLVTVGDMLVREAGPLAGFSSVMDAAARRVLPGHLLRRCRILSSVQIGSTCLQRVALTACSREESIFSWKLLAVEPNPRQYEEASAAEREGLSDRQASADSSRRPSFSSFASSATPSSWLLSSISRDGSSDEKELPSRPHPRAAPELVIGAQLAALARGDIVGAASFNATGRNLMGPWEEQLSAYRSLLRTPSHHLLLTHCSHEIVAAAVPSQRTFVAEVRLQGAGSALQSLSDSEGPANCWSFMWELGMHGSGCWYVQAVRAL